MTHEDLAKLLEQFAVVVLQTARTDLSMDDQYSMITGSIDTIVDTVMFCVDRSRITAPSAN